MKIRSRKRRRRCIKMRNKKNERRTWRRGRRKRITIRR